MNQRGVFMPRDQLRSLSMSSSKAKVAPKPAEKVATVAEVQDPSELSREELELAVKLANDKHEGTAKLYLNGELACVGLHWLPGMEEKWNKR